MTRSLFLPSLALIFLIALPTLPLMAQGPQALPDPNGFRNEIRTINIGRTATKVTLDGELNEAEWSTAGTATGFLNKFPSDSGYAAVNTQAFIMYNDEFLYIGAKCHLPPNGKTVVQSLRRDNDDFHWQSDNFTVVLDPFRTKTNGFIFGVNAGGAQLEGLLNLRGVQTEYDNNWDNKWYSEVSKGNGYWSVEIAIPFKTLRYSENADTWGINFLRADMNNSAYSTWNHVPLGRNGIDMGFMAELQWPSAPHKAKGRVALIPYAAGSVSRDFEEGEPVARTGDIGMDAKVAVTSSLNLDLTVNPDFSNVDVDNQVTNLTRFSILLPERRNFFLENSDLFTNFGSFTTRPFFSRKIGLDDEGRAIPILFGARLSGNLSDRTRLGVLDVQTAQTEEQSAQNYFVGTMHQRIGQRSSVRGLLMNRQGIGTNDYNRVGGVEAEYLEASGKWQAILRHHMTDTEEDLTDQAYSAVAMRHQSRNLYVGVGLERLGDNYINDLGLAQRQQNYDADLDTTFRLGLWQFANRTSYTVFALNNPKVQTHNISLRTLFNWRLNGDFIERSQNLSYGISFANTAALNLSVENNDVRLQFPTKFIDQDESLPAGRYQFTQANLGAQTDGRKLISFGGGIGYGSFYGGTRFSMGVDMRYRVQPWGVFRMSYQQNRVDLGPYGSQVLHLIGPRADISFTNRMFWTTFVQYNNQADVLNINSRFQWRYAPMSDFFVVYSDIYDSALNVQYRALVVKLTYWLNV